MHVLRECQNTETAKAELNHTRLQLLRAKLNVLKAAKLALQSNSHRMKVKPAIGFSFVDKTVIHYDNRTDESSQPLQKRPSTPQHSLPKWNKFQRVASSTELGTPGVTTKQSTAQTLPNISNRTVKSLRSLICLELCAGSANLSFALQQCGFQVLAVDHHRNAHRPTIRCVHINLADKNAWTMIKTVLDHPGCFYVHIAPPYGTASSARNIPLSPELIAAGFPSPVPLRSREHPLGLPGLSKENQLRVEQANKIYALSSKVLCYCDQKKILVSCENPDTSLYWAVPCIVHTESLSSLEDKRFHNCMHGGERAKKSRWRGTKAIFAVLQIFCDNSHTHKEWGKQMVNGVPIFDTALESEYSTPLCATVAYIIRAEAIRQGYEEPADNLFKPLSQDQLRLKLLSTVGKQPRGRKLPQLVSEFQSVTEIVTGISAPTPALLKSQSILRQFLRAEEGSPEVRKKIYIVGTRRSPQDFLDEAIKAGHPYVPGVGISDGIKKALLRILTSGPTALAAYRNKQLKLIQERALQNKTREAEKHKHLPEHLRDILERKQLILFKELLDESGFEDAKIADEMCVGFDVVGKTPPSGILESRLNPATSTQQQLKLEAKLHKWSILLENRRFSEDVLDKEVYKQTIEEFEAGWLDGPHTEASLDLLFPSGWLPVPRFGIQQGPKVRAIDNCKFPGLNSALTTVEKLRLQDTDDLCALITFVASTIRAASPAKRTFEIRLANGQILGGRIHQEWGSLADIVIKGRTLDLKAAYKNAGNSEETLWACVIAVWSPQQCGFEFYISRALMFGSTASVYAFNRIAKALQHLAVTYMSLMCNQFYDDFPCTELGDATTLAQSSFEGLLEVLGWGWSTGIKAPPFGTEFNALGNKLNIKEVVKSGSFFVGNKESRLQNISEIVAEARSSHRLIPSIAAELSGKLQYTAAQIFGDTIKPALRQIRNRADSLSNATEVTAELEFALKFVQDYIFTAPPRLVLVDSQECPILIFTDGSSEGEAHLWGLVVFEAGIRTVVAAGSIPLKLSNHWRKHVGSQIICQVELYPIILVKAVLQTRLARRRVVYYVDNDPSRDGLISGASDSVCSRALLYAFARQQRVCPSYNWMARVPSFSNVADAPSRGEGAQLAKDLNAEFRDDLEVDQSVMADLLDLAC